MIPLVAPLHDAADAEAVSAAARQGLMGSGDIVAAFERAVADRHGMSGGIATSSGTAALQLALAALGVGEGDEVVFPSYTCIALLHATRALGARERLVDNEADPHTMRFNIDPDLALNAIGPLTMAVIVPHAFGVGADISRLLERGVSVIEDCAMSLGASVDSRTVGSRGDLAVFSFHSTKVISTGEGGMLLARDPELLRRARELNDVVAAQVRERRVSVEELSGTYARQFNFRMTDLSAALGLSQLSKLDAFLARRELIAERYNSAFSGLPLVLPARLPRGSFYFRYMVDVSPSGRSVGRVLDGLAQWGIEAGRGVYPAIHQSLGLGGWETSCAEDCTRRMVSIPVHPALSDDEVGRVIVAVRSVLAA